MNILAGGMVGIINTLDSVAKKYKKGYSYPSQITILKLLQQFHEVTFSIRTLNRRLRILEDLGFIERTRRIKRGLDGRMVFNTTLYKLTRKAYKAIGRVVRKITHHKRGYFSQGKTEKVQNPEPEEDLKEEDRWGEREKILDLARKAVKGFA